MGVAQRGLKWKARERRQAQRGANLPHTPASKRRGSTTEGRTLLLYEKARQNNICRFHSPPFQNLSCNSRTKGVLSGPFRVG